MLERMGGMKGIRGVIVTKSSLPRPGKEEAAMLGVTPQVSRHSLAAPMMSPAWQPFDGKGTQLSHLPAPRLTWPGSGEESDKKLFECIWRTRNMRIQFQTVLTPQQSTIKTQQSTSLQFHTCKENLKSIFLFFYLRLTCPDLNYVWGSTV